MASDYDVVIIGGGGAGLAAAIEATEAGASCMILEADTKLGGATALSGGVIYAADTDVQRKAGVAGDTAKAMFDYVMALNQWALKPDIIGHVCDDSAPTLAWLETLGVTFPPAHLVESGVDGVPRGHPADGAGFELAKALINRAGALGIDYALDTRVERLLVEDGRVVGVVAGGTELRAPITIIATGGFGNSDAMRKRFFPSVAQHGDWAWAVHDAAPFILGDGITLGEGVGAAITGHDTGLPLPTSGFGKYIEAFLPPWTMIVNEEGKRFMPEIASYTICGYLINEQTNAHAFAIFDEPTLIEASNDGSYLDPYHTGMTTPIWRNPISAPRPQAAGSRPPTRSTGSPRRAASTPPRSPRRCGATMATSPAAKATGNIAKRPRSCSPSRLRPSTRSRCARRSSASPGRGSTSISIAACSTKQGARSPACSRPGRSPA